MTLPRALFTDGLTADSFPDTGAVILEDSATLEFRVVELPRTHKRQLVALLDHRRRMKVLRPSGLIQADITLPIDGFTTVTDAVARSVAPDGSENWMPHRELHLLQRDDPQTRAPDVQTVSFHIPGGQVGGLLEYRYRMLFTDPGMVPPYVFGATMPVVHSEFGIVTDPEVDLDYRYGNGDTLVQRAPLRRTTQDGRERLVFIETHLPAFFREPHMAHVSHVAPWIAVALRKTTITDPATRIQSWDDVAADVLEQMSLCGGERLPGSVSKRLATVVGKMTPLRLPGLGLRQPQTAQDLFAGSPACSRDATAVALRALVGSPTEARVVLLTGPESPPVPEDFPTRSAFSQAGIAIRADANLLSGINCNVALYLRSPLCDVRVGDWIYVDPLCETCPFGSFPSRFSGGRVLHVNAQQITEWHEVPIAEPWRNSLVSQAKLRFDVDGSLTGTLHAEARGLQAAALRREMGHFTESKTQQVAAGAAMALQLWGQAAAKPSIQSVKVENPQNINAPLGVDLQWATHTPPITQDGFVLAPENLLGSSLPEFWRGVRNTAAILDGPWWKETKIEITLPMGYQVILPPAVMLRTPFGDYAAGYTLKNHVLTYARRFVLKQSLIPAAQWQDFHDFFEQIRTAERQVAHLNPLP